MPLPPIPDAAVVIGGTLRAAGPSGTSDDWRGAIRLAGAALAASGVATPAYADAMIAMVEEHGPYIVISPGLALAHAQSGSAVLGDGLAVVVLDTPVAFGHPHNDPVRVVLGLAVASVGAHLESIGALANLFNDPSVTSRLAAARSAEEVRAIMGSGA